MTMNQVTLRNESMPMPSAVFGPEAQRAAELYAKTLGAFFPSKEEISAEQSVQGALICAAAGAVSVTSLSREQFLEAAGVAYDAYVTFMRAYEDAMVERMQKVLTDMGIRLQSEPGN